MINCKEASVLASKKEDGKLSFSEALRLRFHIMICKVCQMVQKQNSFLITHFKKADKEIISGKCIHQLTEQEKREIQNRIQ